MLWLTYMPGAPAMDVYFIKRRAVKERFLAGLISLIRWFESTPHHHLKRNKENHDG